MNNYNNTNNAFLLQVRQQLWLQDPQHPQLQFYDHLISLGLAVVPRWVTSAGNHYESDPTILQIFRPGRVLDQDAENEFNFFRNELDDTQTRAAILVWRNQIRIPPTVRILNQQEALQRLSLLFGLPPAQSGDHFLQALLNDLRLCNNYREYTQTWSSTLFTWRDLKYCVDYATRLDGSDMACTRQCSVTTYLIGERNIQVYSTRGVARYTSVEGVLRSAPHFTSFGRSHIVHMYEDGIALVEWLLLQHYSPPVVGNTQWYESDVVPTGTAANAITAFSVQSNNCNLQVLQDEGWRQIQDSKKWQFEAPTTSPAARPAKVRFRSDGHCGFGAGQRRRLGHSDGDDQREAGEARNFEVTICDQFIYFGTDVEQESESDLDHIGFKVWTLPELGPGRYCGSALLRTIGLSQETCVRDNAVTQTICVPTHRPGQIEDPFQVSVEFRRRYINIVVSYPTSGEQIRIEVGTYDAGTESRPSVAESLIFQCATGALVDEHPGPHERARLGMCRFVETDEGIEHSCDGEMQINGSGWFAEHFDIEFPIYQP